MEKRAENNAAQSTSTSTEHDDGHVNAAALDAIVHEISKPSQHTDDQDLDAVVQDIAHGSHSNAEDLDALIQNIAHDSSRAQQSHMNDQELDALVNSIKSKTHSDSEWDSMLDRVGGYVQSDKQHSNGQADLEKLMDEIRHSDRSHQNAAATSASSSTSSASDASEEPKNFDAYIKVNSTPCCHSSLSSHCAESRPRVPQVY